MPEKDIIDKINEFLRNVNGPKKCPDPKCNGALLQHRRNPRALFCSSCFKLYELKEATFDRWHNLVAAPKKESRKAKSRGQVS